MRHTCVTTAVIIRQHSHTHTQAKPPPAACFEGNREARLQAEQLAVIALRYEHENRRRYFIAAAAAAAKGGPAGWCVLCSRVQHGFNVYLFAYESML